MARRFTSMLGCFAASLASWTGCTEVTLQEQEGDAVGVTSQALSVCDETVPANRNVDGIPAYTQCSDSANSAIFSNNGVDTSTTQMGSDWVRTQWSGGYQCTELAHRYLYFKWQVKWIPNGNAGFWCDSQPPANSGVEQTMTPVHGDIMVLAPGSCGADPSTGHVNVIDAVNGDKLVAVEQNGARRGNYQLSCAKCFLHVTANDGTPSPASAAGAAGATSATGAAGTPSTPDAPAMQGVAGNRSWGRPSAAGSGAARPSGPAVSPSATAGVAAPTPTLGAAGTAAAGDTRPQAAVTSVGAAGRSSAVQTALTAATAGSLATTPGVVPVSSTRVGAPTEGACTVAWVHGARRPPAPVTLAVGLVGAAFLFIRARRRKS